MKSNILKMPMFWISNLVTALPIVAGLILYNRLPNNMPIHFDVNFEPDGYAPKVFAIILIPLLMVLFNTIVWFALYNDPKGNNINKKFRTVMNWFIPIVSCFLQFAMITYALGLRFNFVRLVPLVIGVIFLVLGNYLPKCKQNYVAGIRTPWTLSNSENWQKTNRLGGHLMVLMGICLILFSFFEVSMVFLVIMIFIVALVPYIYSYYLYRQEK